MADVTRELSDLVALARQRPILIVGGGIGLLLLAAVASRGTDDAEPETDPDAELGSAEGEGTGSDAGAGTLTFGAGYGLPSYGVDGAGGGVYDPFATDQGTQQPTVDYTPDGCPLPKPAIPSGLSGQGDWVCSSGRWTWKSKGTGAPAKPGGKTGPRIVISKGATFNHYRLDKGRLRGEQRKAGSAVTWRTSATPQTMRTYGGSTVRVVQLREGPLSGRWVTIGGDGKRWYPS